MSDKKESRYSARVFWSDSDKAYVAVAPEFDGVSGLGATRDAAVQQLEVALDLAIETYQEEGWELPQPSVEPEYSGQFRVRLPKSLHQWLAAAAEGEGVSLNTLVVQLLSQARGATRATESSVRRLQSIEATLRQSLATAYQTIEAKSDTSNQAFRTEEGAAIGRWGPGTTSSIPSFEPDLN